MSVILSTNVSATISSNHLAYAGLRQQKSLTRLSSGSRIVTPSDDAGGLAVAMKLLAMATRQGAATANLGNASSYLQTQDGALKVTGKVLDRISELKTLYADVTKSTSDKANYDTEYTQLTAQLTTIGAQTFNGGTVFGSTSFAVLTTEDGASASALTLPALDLTSVGSTVGVATVIAATSLSTLGLTTVTAAIQNVATMRASNGAQQSRLDFATELLATNRANLQAAASRITDVDVAEESTQLARWTTLVSSGTAMLAQSNQSSQTALQLLK
jgi:flagellin